VLPFQPAELQTPVPADKPATTTAEKPAAASKSQSGWKVFHTPEGRPYYHNSATNQTTWQRPAEMVRSSTLASCQLFGRTTHLIAL
jgi:hypothetical protein